jgi:hypothetical protein
MLSSFFKKIVFVFLFQKNWGRLPLNKILRCVSYFIYLGQNNVAYRKLALGCLEKIEVVILLKRELRSSSIFKNIEVIFHIFSSWVKLRLHTENQLPGLPGISLKVCVERCVPPTLFLGWRWAMTIMTYLCKITVMSLGYQLHSANKRF